MAAESPDDDLSLELEELQVRDPQSRPRPVLGQEPLGQIGDGPPGEPEVYLRVRVVEAILQQARTAGSAETGGLLAGSVCLDAHGVYLRVESAVAAQQARQGRISLTFTHESWAGMHEALERDCPGQDVLGWYHTHPALGVFLSGQDLFIQRSFFGGPHQVALVVDPTINTWGVFRWHGDCQPGGECSLAVAGRLFVYACDPAEGARLPDLLDTLST